MTASEPKRARTLLGWALLLVSLVGLPLPALAQETADSVSLTLAGFGSCRLRPDARPACWGGPTDDELSDPYVTINPPNEPLVAISAGHFHRCGIRSNGTLTCWGFKDLNNDWGQWNPPAGTFIDISAGFVHNCAIRGTGAMACWGGGELFDYGQSSPPAGNFIDVSVGYLFSCGIHADGTVACWGYNGHGQSSPPAGTFVKINAGVNHMCGVRTDGSLACWGYNSAGQASPPAGTFIDVDAGFQHSCAVRSDGTLACWGANYIGATTPPAGTFISINSGHYHSCAARSDGTLACWGWNYYGGAPQLALLPVALPGGTTAAYTQAISMTDVSFRSISPTNPELSPYSYLPPSPGFAVVDGTLPPGLSLSSGGVLSGTPTVFGTYSFTIEGEDANGFAAQRAYALTIGEFIDDTPPVIVATLSGPLGNNGWYVGDATVEWSVVDDGSVVTSNSGCATSTVGVDAGGMEFTCSATSAGGTASASVTVKRDATAPTLAPTVSPAVLLLNGTGSTNANATDALSGVATQQCGALDTSSTGAHASACTATDVAGNSATASATYTVAYGFVGFTAPVDNPPQVNLAKAGQTIAFKWRVVDANGAPVANLAGVTFNAIAMTCDGGATDEVEQYVVAGSGFQNHGNGYYQYNWQSPKSYQDTCRMVVIDLGDGSARVAQFRFK